MLGQLRVITPEGITFKHEIAGVGSRSLASLVDVLIVFAIIFVVQMLFLLMIFLLAVTGLLSNSNITGILTAILVFVQFLAIWAYRAVCETKFSASVGYRTASIKVVTYKGSKPLFWQCAIRSLLWPIECVFFPVAAFVSVLLTSKQQRLADLFAGTIVVHANRSARLGTLQVQDAALDENAAFRQWEISRVSDDEVYLIRRFLDRRVRLSQNIRLDLANKLYALVIPKTSGVPSDWYAEAVLEGIAASRAVANARG